MMKLAAKFLLGTALVAGVADYTLGSYAGAFVTHLTTAVKGAVPLEFELDRARHLIREMTPKLNSARRRLAEAQVRLDDLREEHSRKVGAARESRGRLAEAMPLCSESTAGPELRRAISSYKSEREAVRHLKDAIQEHAHAVETYERDVEVTARRMSVLMATVERLRTRLQVQYAQERISPGGAIASDAFEQVEAILAGTEHELEVRARYRETASPAGVESLEPESLDELVAEARQLLRVDDPDCAR